MPIEDISEEEAKVLRKDHRKNVFLWILIGVDILLFAYFAFQIIMIFVGK